MKTNNLWVPFICLFILLAALSCHKSYCPELLSAENIIEENPDSAYITLQKIKQNQIQSSANNAKYILLKTQALIKLDSILTDTAPIDTTVSYFAENGSRRDYMKSLFYSAWIKNTNDNEYEAMTNAIGAYEIARELDDNYWLAKSAELISEIFSNNYNIQESYRFEKEAKEYYKKVGKIENSYYSMVGLATDLLSMNRPEQALGILDSIPSLDDEYRNNVLLAYADRIKLYSYFGLKCYKQADSVFTEMEKLNNYYPICPLSYHIKVLLLCLQQEEDKIPYYLQLGDSLAVSQREQIAMLRAHMNYNALRGNYDNAYSIAESLIEHNDQLSRNIFKDSATLAQRDYYNKKSEQEHIRAERQRFIIIGVSITAILMIIGGIIYYRLNLRMKNLEISDMTSQIRLISERLKHSDEQNSILAQTISEKDCQLNTLTRNNDCTATNNVPYDILKAKVMNVFSRDLRNISTTCNELYNDVDEKTQKILLKKIKSDLENMRSLKNIKTVERLVNQYRNDIMANARKDLKGLDNKNFIMMTLLYSGIDTDLICVLLDIKHNSFGPTKGRLKAKIESLKCPEAMRYTRTIL